MQPTGPHHDHDHAPNTSSQQPSAGPEKLPGILKSMASHSRKRPPFLPIPMPSNGKTWNTLIMRIDLSDWEFHLKAASSFWFIPIGE